MADDVAVAEDVAVVVVAGGGDAAATVVGVAGSVDAGAEATAAAAADAVTAGASAAALASPPAVTVVIDLQAWRLVHSVAILLNRARLDLNKAVCGREHQVRAHDGDGNTRYPHTHTVSGINPSSALGSPTSTRIVLRRVQRLRDGTQVP